MRINCIICCDLFVVSDDIYVTNCGHVFHHVCLIQWFERSKTCPQCRGKTAERDIHRLYFNVAAQEQSEDPSSLENKLENMRLQLKMKDMDVKKAEAGREEYKKQNKGLREEVKTLEKKIRDNESTVSAFKGQLSYMQTQCKEAEEAKGEAHRLRKRLDDLRNVKMIIEGSEADTEDILATTNDGSEAAKSFATYCSALKKVLKTANDKKKDLAERVSARDHEILNLKKKIVSLEHKLKEHLTLNSLMQEDLKHAEEEKQSLERKLRELEKAIISPSGDPKSSALQRLIMESPAPQPLKRPKLSDPVSPIDLCTPPSIASSVSSSSKRLHDSENESPYLKVKSSSIGLTPLRPVSKSNSQPSDLNKLSIFSKARSIKPLTSACVSIEAYDGLGGHSKVDDFPVPKRGQSTLKKNRSAVLLTKSLSKPPVTKINRFFDAL